MRQQINAAQMENVRKEKDHRILMERGLDLLVDVELGVAPSMELLLANAREATDGTENTEFGLPGSPRVRNPSCM